MLGIDIGKTENRDDTFAVRGGDIAAGFEKELGRVAKELLRRLGKCAWLGIVNQVVFVRDIANHHRRLTGARFSFDRDLSGNGPVDLFLRQPPGEQ